MDFLIDKKILSQAEEAETKARAIAKAPSISLSSALVAVRYQKHVRYPRGLYEV